MTSVRTSSSMAAMSPAFRAGAAAIMASSSSASSMNGVSRYGLPSRRCAISQSVCAVARASESPKPEAIRRCGAAAITSRSRKTPFGSVAGNDFFRPLSVIAADTEV